jgi:CelD/BcsL family acetyltransferase involved in cellulose biosynthesis
MANFNRPRENYKRRMKRHRKEARRLSEHGTPASVAAEKKETSATKTMGR